MRHVVLTLALLSGLLGSVAAQPATFRLGAEALVPAPGILSNGISNLHAEGDTLWAGPFLSLTTDGGATWQAAEADSLGRRTNRVFSIDVEGEVVWVGLGFTSQTDDGNFQAAGGFLVSRDGGRTFTYRGPQLDDPGDTSIQYGMNTLEALPVIVPEQSPPFDIDYDQTRDVVWMAGWASGIRRSDDGGRTWQRVVLPPDSLSFVQPSETYDFEVAPRRAGAGEYNYLGFSVLVDEAGTVWAGTPKGINRSDDGGLSWTRTGFDGTPNSPPGSWTISIEEQPLAGRNPVWFANWDAGPDVEVASGSQFGVSVTRDGGQTFNQTLLGERIYDFAFRGTTVYAAGTRGLFISQDGGQTWRTVRDFIDRDQPDRIVRPNAEVLAVATTEDALWLGTDDGLLKSVDGGQTWRLFRAEVPLDPAAAPPGVDPEAVPAVDAYAYPNPFSPAVDRVVRIRYDLDSSMDVRIRVFDFGMNLVRDLTDASQPGGAREVAWDGTDDDGARVANGVYLYAVEAGGDTFWGKVLVLE